eukprot:COSAG01_NODE_5795_length_4031_cov_2.927263_3_plen_61_part_00
MKGWISAGESLKAKLGEIDGQLYPLLCWILCSMRGHLRYISPSGKSLFCKQTPDDSIHLV